MTFGAQTEFQFATVGVHCEILSALGLDQHGVYFQNLDMRPGDLAEQFASTEDMNFVPDALHDSSIDTIDRQSIGIGHSPNFPYSDSHTSHSPKGHAAAANTRQLCREHMSQTGHNARKIATHLRQYFDGVSVRERCSWCIGN